MSSSNQVLCNSLLYSHRGASQRSALPSCDDVQHMGLSDVKLFGKSLLSQPNLMASSVPSLSASSNGNVTLPQPAFSNISIPVASIGTRGALSKVYGMDSVALLHLEGLGVPIWCQRVGRLCGQNIQQPSLGTWDYGRG